MISDDAKMELLTFLRRAHGRTQDSTAPRKITLKRKSHVLVVGANNSAVDAALETWRKGATATRSSRCSA